MGESGSSPYQKIKNAASPGPYRKGRVSLTALTGLGFAMKNAESIPLGTVVHGRYRVEQRLGEGGMGSVYEVEHLRTGQRHALKVLNPKMVNNDVALERFKRESRAPARIKSDHVVQVTDADVAPELGGAPFLVMELLQGESFDQLLADRALPPKEAILYLGQVARALEKAHALGIIHRDIKPENLFLTHREDGTPWVKLLDFGIAKLTEGAADGPSVSKTATGAIFGTPLYMAPEQILGQPEKICPQTDIWAFGVIAHRMLTAREPWTAQTLPHLVAQVAYEPLPIPSQLGSTLGPEFDDWFARCCARAPQDRFASATEAVTALARALGEHVEPSRPRVDSTASGRQALLRRSSAEDALAATAAATPEQLGSAISSDTLAAQVTAKKSSGPVIVLAVIAGIAVAGAGIYFVAKNAGANAGAQVAPAAPLTEVVQRPTPTATETSIAPSATGPSVAPAPIEPPPSAKPAVKPVGKSTTSPSKPTSTQTSKDPLDQGRK
jgi:serine/threonine-protein kinase